jgi:hypothetical protein
MKMCSLPLEGPFKEDMPPSSVSSRGGESRSVPEESGLVSCLDMNQTNGVVSYLFSRSDRRLGEEQPPLPPMDFESGGRIWKLFLAFSLRPSLRMASEQGFISETRAQAYSAQPLTRR